MKLSARSAAFYCVTLAGLLALSACGKNEQQSANQPAASSTAPAPASTAAHPAPSTTAAAPAHSATAPAPAAPAPASTAAAAPAAAEGFQVSTITLGDAVNADHKVKKDMTTFSPTQKTIYVSVDTTGNTPGATINAKWTYLDKDQMIVSTSQSIIADSPSTTTFSMKNPDLWPEGKYKVDISVDGKQVSSKTFEVKKS
ncbi:hypothetical protein [Dyella nitratireducens]|uniref:Uncharacterized protein n=1 Tax=Dyella nitratireducens TaxID=1849580 RepID=A0ABQ1FQV5_9GAMM|nr:hypothetical protein [Dyella nitratireducens]GGA27149.1 hypothetical protein GCM10010981_14800 [Dyella nitratireducens]GLQ43455.1 hypothetical protein GCM10007902_33050 [Dyella nitratireducens]